MTDPRAGYGHAPDSERAMVRDAWAERWDDDDVFGREEQQ